jgi:hypothetical protein
MEVLGKWNLKASTSKPPSVLYSELVGRAGSKAAISTAGSPKRKGTSQPQPRRWDASRFYNRIQEWQQPGMLVPRHKLSILDASCWWNALKSRTRANSSGPALEFSKKVFALHMSRARSIASTQIALVRTAGSCSKKKKANNSPRWPCFSRPLTGIASSVKRKPQARWVQSSERTTPT